MTRSVHDFDLLMGAELMDIQVFLKYKKARQIVEQFTTLILAI